MADDTAPLIAADLDEIEEQARNGCYANPEDAVRLVAMARRVEGLERALQEAVRNASDMYDVTEPVAARQWWYARMERWSAALTPTTEATDE